MNPICPIHKTEMILQTGLHAESGGFVDNYWCCSERDCRQIFPARNREEAEEESYYQLHIKEISEKVLKQWKEEKSNIKYTDVSSYRVVNIINDIIVNAEDKWYPTIKITKRQDGLFDITVEYN